MHAGLVYFKFHIVSRVISYATMLHLDKLFVDDRSNFCVRTGAPATSEAIAVRVVSGTCNFPDCHLPDCVHDRCKSQSLKSNV